MSTKNPLTPAGIEPATFRFVAQHLNHCATAVPREVVLGRYNSREDVNNTRAHYNFTLYCIVYPAWNVCCVNHKVYLTSVWKIACRSNCSLSYCPDISIFTYLEENHMWFFPLYLIPEPNLNSHFSLRNSYSILGRNNLLYEMMIFTFKERYVIEASEVQTEAVTATMRCRTNT